MGMRDRPPHPYAAVSLHGTVMLEFLVITLIAGFGAYYLIRHPLLTLKRALQGVGLIILGLVVISLFAVGVPWLQIITVE